MRLSRSCVVSTCVAAVVLAGCTGGTSARRAPSDTVTVAWTRIRLPEAGSPSLLANGPEDSVLVGVDGDSGGQSPPQVLRLRAGRSQPVPVQARTYYGRRAVWGALASGGRALYAFGGRSGGAHGNTRWSAWAGREALEEEPQAFETFGGPKAGGLAGLAVVGDRPVLLGSHVGADGTGLDVAVWTRSGSRWARRDSRGTPLAASDDAQPSAHAIVARGSGLLVAGSLTELGPRPRTVPAAWTATAPEGAWTRLELVGAHQPVAEAHAAACTRAETCLVVGDDGGRLVGWQLSSGGGVTAAHLPRLAVDPEHLAVAFAGRADGDDRFALAVATPGGGSRVLVGGDGRWREVTGPPGAMTSWVVVDRTMWSVTSQDSRSGLWSAPIP